MNKKQSQYMKNMNKKQRQYVKNMEKADKLKQRYWNKGDVKMYKFWSNAASGFFMRTISPQCINSRRMCEIPPRVEKRKKYNRFYLIKLAFLKLIHYY